VKKGLRRRCQAALLFHAAVVARRAMRKCCEKGPAAPLSGGAAFSCRGGRPQGDEKVL
jgi:hypothetical protein